MTYDFHTRVGIPDSVELPTGIFTLDPTQHARKEAATDKYQPFEIPKTVYVTEDSIFEVTTDRRGNVEKFGAELPYSEEYKLACIIDPDDGTLITTWLNHVGDNHETLDESEYTHPDAVKLV